MARRLRIEKCQDRKLAWRRAIRIPLFSVQITVGLRRLVLSVFLAINIRRGSTRMKKQINELLLQALETELGGVQVYMTAVTCAVNKDLKEEGEKYLDQTTHHVEILRDVFEQLGLDSKQETPGRQVVRHIGESLVKAMKMAIDAGDPKAAEVVACECVVLAETKDHLNWALLSELASHIKGKESQPISEAVDQVEDQEDEHLYHTKGWCRELWIANLGMPAVLPPPEEEKDVKTAIGAARAEKAREEMLA
jgi:rubrerythrin